MFKCSECGTEVSEYSAQLCTIDECPNVFCLRCLPDDRLCKDHRQSSGKKQSAKGKKGER
jgi:hypothetical protein